MATNMPENNSSNWYKLSPEQIAERLSSDLASGLHSKAAAEKLLLGRNQLRSQSREGFFTWLYEQFQDLMVLILLAAAIVAGLLGEFGDSITIVVIVLLNAGIGVSQRWRTENALAALEKLSTPMSTVIRDGKARRIDSEELVAGDLVLLEAGDLVPADLRITEAVDIAADESLLTGESLATEKSRDSIEASSLALGDQHNMLFKGTQLSRGRGSGMVVSTGMETELGKIAHLLGQARKEKTPLQRRLQKLGQQLAWLVLAICALVVLLGVLSGGNPVVMLLTGISLAVAAIPEALPAVVAVTLAIGAWRMSRQNALIRRLPAVETLGSVNIICSDKTGTLTENRMRVDRVIAVGNENTINPADNGRSLELGRVMALCHNVMPGEAGQWLGEATELALVQAASEAGHDISELKQSLPRIAELPFSSERKRMTTFHRDRDTFLVLGKGAPEVLLDACMLTDSERSEWQQKAEQMAGEGYRMIALAQKRVDKQPDDLKNLESGMEFLGLLALMDPPRETAAESVALCHQAGIHTVMMTGDHPSTALAIARRVGIADKNTLVVTGAQLSEMEEQERQEAILATRIFARVDPAQKIHVVETWQGQGKFVAMTGDGINDAPALKKADIGIAMGKKGTDVARSAADMVLTDDHFSSIVAAIHEGRRIYDNIRKFIRYTLTSNTGEILALTLAPLLGMPIPLLPIQILWINLVTDGLPGLALATEPAEPGIMKKPPRDPDESLFAQGLWQQILLIGSLIGFLSLASQYISLQAGLAHWQTIVFTTLTLTQLANALVIRSQSQSIWQLGWRSNLPMTLAIILTVGLQMAVIYIPWLQDIFHTSALSPVELAGCFLASIFLLLILEAAKKWQQIGKRA